MSRNRRSLEPKSRNRRRANGYLMMEALVAIVLSSVIALILFQAAADGLRVSTTTRNDILAEEVIDELIEQTLAYGFSGLKDYPGPHDLKLNRMEMGDNGPPVRRRPLLLDHALKTWKNPKSASQANLLDCEILYEVLLGPAGNTIDVTITIVWRDSASGSQMHRKSRTVSLVDEAA